jgi:diguanylate cyclase (GGDEF)-like protein/PAS domain S-box-containing protein
MSTRDRGLSEFARARAWQLYLALGVGLGIMYGVVGLPATKLIFWPLLAWSSVIAIVVGVRVNRPAVRGPWYLLAAGVAMFAAGDNLYSFRSYVLHSDAVFPSIVDVVYLAVYPLLFAGLAWMVRERSSGRDRASMIDAGIITASVGLVAWVLLIAPYVRSSDLGIVVRLVSIAYPLADIALLAIAARLAFGSGRRPIAFWLLAGSLIPLIAADSVYGYLNLTGGWHEHNIVDIGWIAFYVGWGAAALHPSMVQLAIASPTRRNVNARRLVFVGSAVLIAPLALFIEQTFDHVIDGTAIALVSAVTFVLVMIRVAGLAREVADERSETRFETLIDNASDAILVVSTGGTVRYHTPSSERVLGGGPSEFNGRQLADRLERGDAEQLELLLTGLSASTTVEWHVHRPDGEWRDLEVIAADMRGVTGVEGLVLTMRDITDRKHLDAELRRQALHDTLTSLPNRALFLDRVGHALSRGHRDGHAVGVLFMDLDDFKLVNDSLGHAAGDDLLIAVAARLTMMIRPGDTVARFGGDEFALLVEDVEVDSKIGDVADRVQEAFQEPLAIGDDHVLVRVSIGIAIGGSDTHNPDELLRDADAAMYVAKRNGKARHVFFEATMHEEAQRRLAIAADLHGAIDRNELAVFYQPIVDVHGGRTCGAEALVRWHHPTRGLLQPVEFIPISETNGVIIPLGRWVLGEACAQVQRWKVEGLVGDAFYITVNLSARHLQDSDVVDHVVAALQRSQLSPGALVLEVTETALLEDHNRTRSTLAALKRLGIRLAVDDFGTGYSSLSYLSAFPFDVIKIDKSFIDQLALTSGGEAMVRAVVELAHTLGLEAVAEGVEDREQADALERLGCALAQGFLFARPMAASDMADALTRRHATVR